jgi:hypothetical protein
MARRFGIVDDDIVLIFVVFTCRGCRLACIWLFWDKISRERLILKNKLTTIESNQIKARTRGYFERLDNG